MAATTSSRSTRSTSGPVLPISPSAPAGGGGGFASSSSFFHHHHHPRSTSPTRVQLIGGGASHLTPSLRFSFSLDNRRSTSPGRSLAVADRIAKKPAPAAHRRTCTCSPTSHPGSFRCSYHKEVAASRGRSPSPSIRLNLQVSAMKVSAMKNSLVWIGTVEGDLVKRALAALIRPCAHRQRRRTDFQARPSRLSVMSKACDP